MRTLIWTAVASLFLFAVSTKAQTTAFTYQGRLQNNGSPANGNYDFSFGLFTTNSTNSGHVCSTQTNLGVGVTNGLFMVELNFGGVFTGSDYWLAIGVRTNGDGGFTALTPLQAVTPTPYAIYASNSGSAASANSVAASNITGTITAAQLPDGIVTNSFTVTNFMPTNIIPVGTFYTNDLNFSSSPFAGYSCYVLNLASNQTYTLILGTNDGGIWYSNGFGLAVNYNGTFTVAASNGAYALFDLNYDTNTGPVTAQVISNAAQTTTHYVTNAANAISYISVADQNARSCLNPSVAKLGTLVYQQDTGHLFLVTQTNLLNIPAGFLDLGAQALFYPVIVVDGDSLFDGDNGVPWWPEIFNQPDVTVFDVAIPGNTLSNIMNQYPTNGHQYAPTNTLSPSWFILDGGHNDINNYTPARSAAQIYSDAITILTSARTDGFKCVLCTIPASAFIYANASNEAIRQAYNLLVRTNALASNYMVLDLDVLIPTNTSDLYYRQPDGLHFSLNAETQLAEYMKTFLGYTTANNLTNSLVSSLAFDSGSVAMDSIGSNTWVNVGNVTTNPGVVGSSAAFNGTNQWLSTTPNWNLGGTNGFSFGCWFYASNVVPEQELSGQYYQGDGYGTFSVNLANGNLSVYTGALSNISWGTPVKSNTWYYLVASYSNGIMGISVNGTIPKRATIGGIAPVSTYPITLGASENNGSVAPANQFAGRLDSVTFWTRILDENEITTLYNAGVGLEIPIIYPTQPLNTPLVIANTSSAIGAPSASLLGSNSFVGLWVSNGVLYARTSSNGISYVDKQIAP